MFEDNRFDRYQHEQIPLNRDSYLVDERYAGEYESMYLSVFEGSPYRPVGYVSYVAVRAVRDKTVELSWYPNVFDRFHEVSVSLPQSTIRECVGSWQWDWKPTIFVESSWLDALYAKVFSVFGMIDAIEMRKAIDNQELSRTKLVQLRDKIDDLAARHRDVSFISFADSVLVKSNWTVGSVRNNLTYTYRPETFVTVAKEFQEIFANTLGLRCYTILTQGYNEYYSDEPLHISDTRNHVCLNSLGVSFAQLAAIDNAVRDAIRSGKHPPAEIYLDESFYHSLALRYEYNKNSRPKSAYTAVMSAKPAHYYYADVETILEYLERK